jgi:hypothetical protein
MFAYPTAHEKWFKRRNHRPLPPSVKPLVLPPLSVAPVSKGVRDPIFFVSGRGWLHMSDGGSMPRRNNFPFPFPLLGGTPTSYVKGLLSFIAW